jgi:hypothetical protein
MSKRIAAAMILASLAFAPGCQSSGTSGGTGVLRTGIPLRAEKVQEGAGQLVYTPEQSGRLYLYDANNESIVEAFQVRKGQRFAVDAAAGRATLEGNEVSVGKLSKGVPPPLGPRPVPVEFHTVAVRVVEIERLAHAVARGTR